MVVSDLVNAEALQMQGFFFARWFKQKLARKMLLIAGNAVLHSENHALTFKEEELQNANVQNATTNFLSLLSS